MHDLTASRMTPMPVTLVYVDAEALAEGCLYLAGDILACVGTDAPGVADLTVSGGATCGLCEGRVSVTDSVIWVDDVYAPGVGEALHLQCTLDAAAYGSLNLVIGDHAALTLDASEVYGEASGQDLHRGQAAARAEVEADASVWQYPCAPLTRSASGAVELTGRAL